MCFCEERTLWLLCGGKYKFLLRSAWIVLTIATLIDVSSIIAYWQLEPKSRDSEFGLRLSLILLIAVLILYFFAVLLSCFVILKLSPRKSEPYRQPTRLERITDENDLIESLAPLHQSMSYCDGFRRVLPNNAPPLPQRNSNRTGLMNFQDEQNRCINRENTRSNVGSGSCNTIKEPNLIDGANSSQSYVEMEQASVVPEIVIVGPEDSVSYNENNVEQPTTCQNLSCNANTYLAHQNKKYLPQNYFYNSSMGQFGAVGKSNIKASSPEAETRLKNCSKNSFIRPASSGSESHINRSNTMQNSSDKREGTEMAAHQRKMGSRNTETNLIDRSVPSRSESCLYRSDTMQHFVDERDSSKIAMPQRKVDSRFKHSNPRVKHVSTKPESCININKYYKDDRQTSEMSMPQVKIPGRITHANSYVKPISTLSESYLNKSDSIQHYSDERQTLEMSMRRAKIDSRNTSANSSSKPITSNSGSYINKSDTKRHYTDGRTPEESMHRGKTDLRVLNAYSTYKPISSSSENCRFDTNQHCTDERKTSQTPKYQAITDSKIKNSDSSVKPISSESESYAKNSYTNQCFAGEREASVISLQSAKIGSRRSTSAISCDDFSGSSIATSVVSEQYKQQPSTIIRYTDSYMARSQPVVNHFRIYSVEKFPSTLNHETHALLKAVSRSEDLFQQSTNQITVSNASPTNNTLSTDSFKV